MKLKQQTRLSILVIVLAAVLLEANTALEFFSTRRSFNEQLTEKAQRDLNESHRIGRVKQEVETAVRAALPTIERLAVEADADSLRQAMRQLVLGQEQIVGVSVGFQPGYVHGGVGAKHTDGALFGLYVYEVGEDKDMRLKEPTYDIDYTQRPWYERALGSNGYWSDAPQTPRGIMNDAIARKHEMAWMERIGIAGIKVDFFGGDKQQTMQLYEDILSDAKDHHLAVIFHGCTIPRGWERMYPNYIASEAALASENVFFTEYHAKKEGFEMTMHPFSRNAIGSFDWGGVIMNRYLSRDNRSRHPRYTSNVFELATAITNQTSVNCVEVTPQTDSTVNAVERTFLKDIPTTWRETKFIDGYPTRYAVIARQDAVSGKWFVGGLNGLNKPLQLTLSLPMLAGQQVTLITDGKNREAVEKTVKVGTEGKLKVSFQPMGGIVIRQK